MIGKNEAFSNFWFFYSSLHFISGGWPAEARVEKPPWHRTLAESIAQSELLEYIVGDQAAWPSLKTCHRYRYRVMMMATADLRSTNRYTEQEGQKKTREEKRGKPPSPHLPSLDNSQVVPLNCCTAKSFQLVR